ncbi:DUF2085 domain-containing protein [Candidatus Dojkabacteria bacterium]|nr:DUF2085 domain-containing protein [Candidatus Dojkabacteria bacterium]
MRFEDKLSKNIFDYFIYFLVVLNVLPILAPIFAHFGLTFLSEPIYTIYSFTCHQFHWRSIHVYDEQIAWCARDVFIWMSFLFTCIAIRINFLPHGLKWYWIIPFVIPIALDGGFQTLSTFFGFSSDFHVYLSTNLMRMITGAIFGMGLGLVIAPFMKAEQDYERRIKSGT